MSQVTPFIFFVVFTLGTLPALFWLWFWLREDTLHPEPRSLIILAFLAGALSILFAFPLESWARDFLAPGLGLFIVWALIEETLKLCAAFFATYHRKAFDEPLDYMIYLIAVAIGFAAFENVLFLLKGFYIGGLAASAITASMRFVGATLLHVLASSILGGFLGLAYCEGRKSKIVHALLGIAAATIIHALFNFAIVNVGSVLVVFIVLWLAVVGLLLFFEKVKHVVCTIR